MRRVFCSVFGNNETSTTSRITSMLVIITNLPIFLIVIVYLKCINLNKIKMKEFISVEN